MTIDHLTVGDFAEIGARSIGGDRSNLIAVHEALGRVRCYRQQHRFLW